MLETQKEMDEQGKRLHEMVLTPAQVTYQNILKILEEVCQIIQGYLMIKCSQEVVRQISAQKANVRLSSFTKLGGKVDKYAKPILIAILSLLLIRALRAYLMYVVVDTFL